MSFTWSKKVKLYRTESYYPEAFLPEETVQIVLVPEPEVCDKISPLEHKNGEQVDYSCKEDNEDNEVQGDIQEGGRVEESDYGSEEVVAQHQGQHNSEEASQSLIESDDSSVEEEQ